mmetsp:Transcript_4588/g.9989  ORF Transcript_4588/g.9989 Transcript_4588/m.9989 type:complete len:281 (-) Transcript_4588:1161-2003(-)
MSTSFFSSPSWGCVDPVALNSCCFFCHSSKVFFHSSHLVLKASPGTRSSTLDVIFLADIHFFMYSFTAASLAHSYLTSSKPSLFSGKVNLVKVCVKTASEMSGIGDFLKFIFFSSSESSTGSISSSLSSSSSAGSSFASSLGSSSSFFSSFISSSGFASSLPPSTSIFSSPSPSVFTDSIAAFLAALSLSASISLRLSSISFFFLSISLFRSFSSFFRLNSTSAASVFSFSIFAWTDSFQASSGSPMTTMQVFLKCVELNFLRLASRSSLMRFDFTSMMR